MILNKLAQLVAFFTLAFVLSSCFTQRPKYAHYSDVMKVETGMTHQALEDTLGLEPHYIRSQDSTGKTVYAYKYRTKDLKRIPWLMKRNTGIETDGDYVDLFVTVNPEGQVTYLETCTNCQSKELETTIIDFNSLVRGITTMITVTLPAVLVLLTNN